MSVYAIGDIQGCLGALECLLDRISFNPDRDRLLLVGDLVARGPDSLGTLRLLYRLRQRIDAVLGNHDLHLLALAHGREPKKNKDQDLLPILQAPDSGELLEWLRHLPLLHEEPDFNAVMTHAGLPPLWSLAQARERAAEVAEVLRRGDRQQFFDNMYGNEPAGWDDALEGPTRWRVITNHFTRMRFVNQAGELELATKGEADAPPPGFFPWFEHPRRVVREQRILFGHWAALAGQVADPMVEALDRGCVWGGQLAALRLNDLSWFSCDCRQLS